MPDGGPADLRFPFNPNGSIYDIAGICDPSGRIFGLMPHPEAFNHWTNHPDWTRIRERKKRGQSNLEFSPTMGIQLFKNATKYVSNKAQL
jgi:phosphoribosylformylglycinamidine synthase